LFGIPRPFDPVKIRGTPLQIIKQNLENNEKVKSEDDQMIREVIEKTFKVSELKHKVEKREFSYGSEDHEEPE